MIRRIATALIVLGMVSPLAASAQWAGPTQAPPSGTSASPINTSATAQVKSGGLSVGSFINNGGSYFVGNVGIGTSTPGTNLEVFGNVRHSTTGGSFDIRPVSATQFVIGPSTDSANSINLITLWNATRANDAVLNIYGKGTDWNRYLVLTHDGTSGFIKTAGSTGGDIVLSPQGTEKARLTAAGSLGVGTTPAAPLHVSGASYVETGKFQGIFGGTEAYNASPMAGILFRNKYNSGGSAAGMGGIAVGKDNVTDGDYGGYLSLYTRTNGGSVAERLRINSAGNVGIGTTNPQYKLDVQQTVNDTQARILSTTAGAWLALDSYSDGYQGLKLLSNTVAKWLIGESNGVTDFAISRSSDGASNRFFTVTTAGNVGVGTTSPLTTLAVGGTITTTGGVRFADGTTQTTAATGSGTMGGSGTTNYIPKFTAASTLGNSLVSDNGTTVNVAGPVTSGTINGQTISSAANLTGSLAVAGNIQMAAGTYLNLAGGTTYKVGQGAFFDTINSAIAGDPLEIGYSMAAPTKICASLSCATYSAYFGTDGNVGIGTTAPGYKLEINGGLGFTQANPSITASSYLVVPNGMYITNGNLYTEQAIRARGGILDDVHANLSISGGTSGNTTIYGTTFPNYLGRSAHANGFMVGSYNSVGANDGKTNPIYTIGSSYNPTDTALSNMYGIGFSHSNFWGAGKSSGWGLYQASAGTIYNTISDGGIWSGGTITSAGAMTAPAFYYSSDRNLKKNITPLASSLDKVTKLQGVSFDWKKDGKASVGLIAQDVEKVYPELVSTNKETGLKSVEYGNLVAPLIEAIKEQQKQIDTLKKEVEALKAR